MGQARASQAAIWAAVRSTTQTLMCGQFSAMTAMVGPPTYPAPMQQMFSLKSDIWKEVELRAEEKKRRQEEERIRKAWSDY